MTSASSSLWPPKVPKVPHRTVPETSPRPPKPPPPAVCCLQLRDRPPTVVGVELLVVMDLSRVARPNPPQYQAQPPWLFLFFWGMIVRYTVAQNHPDAPSLFPFLFLCTKAESVFTCHRARAGCPRVAWADWVALGMVEGLSHDEQAWYRVLGLSVFGSRSRAKDHGLPTVQRTAYPT